VKGKNLVELAIYEFGRHYSNNLNWQNDTAQVPIFHKIMHQCRRPDIAAEIKQVPITKHNLNVP
jgi:hypothetical protein